MGRPGPLRARDAAPDTDARTGLGLPRRGPAARPAASRTPVAAVSPQRGGDWSSTSPRWRSGRLPHCPPDWAAAPTTSNLDMTLRAASGRRTSSTSRPAARKVTVYAANADVHVVVDVHGWTSNGGTSVPPGEGLFSRSRPTVLDNRKSAALGPGESRGLRSPARRGGWRAGAGVSAVMVKLTVTRPHGPRHPDRLPRPAALPSTRNLNFWPARPGPTGSSCRSARAATSPSTTGLDPPHVVVDVNGWYTARGRPPAVSGSRAHAIRLEDTRRSPLGPMVDKARNYQVAGGAASRGRRPRRPHRVVVDVTAVRSATTTGGYLTLCPADIPTRRRSATVTSPAPGSFPNLVVAGLSIDGGVDPGAAAPRTPTRRRHLRARRLHL